MGEYCKYFNNHMKTLKAYCECLYKLDGCGAGGLLHILLDDNNYTDHDILFCMAECLKHPEQEESKLGILICEEYLNMSMKERTIFDWFWCGSDLSCEQNHAGCENCEMIDWSDLE